MDRRAVAGGSGNSTWTGRAKQRPPASYRQLPRTGIPTPQRTQTARKQGTSVVRTPRKSAPGPLSWLNSEDEGAALFDTQERGMDLDRDDFKEEEEEEAEAVDEEEDEEEEEEAEAVDVEEEQKQLAKEPPRRVMHATKRAMPATDETFLQSLRSQEFDAELVSRLRLKLKLFLDAGESLVTTIQQLEQMNKRRRSAPRPRMGSEVLGAVQEIVSKNFQLSEVLVKALIQFQSGAAPGQGGASS